MMDGRTDKYKRLPYFAVRMSVVRDWKFKSHHPCYTNWWRVTLQHFVKLVLEEFLPQNKKCFLFNTIDTAVNMKLISKLLGHERINCIAHCLQLLLTVDSFFKVPQLCVLLRKCKDVISCLHFKGYTVAQEIEHEKDADLLERVTSLMEQLVAEEDNRVADDDSTDNQSLMKR